MSPRFRNVLAATALALAVLPAAAQAAATDLKVMVRNVYLGADLIPLATQTDRAAFEQAAAERYQTVLRNDFATRAKALAREIRTHKPDVIGVQEAAVWRRGAEGVKDGSATPASDVVYDSTEVLLKALADLGQRYRVIAGRDWFDFEAPTALGFDVRLTQRDVILGRTTSRVRFGKTLRGGFTRKLDVPTQAGVASQKRGYVAVDGKLAGKSFRFVTTHLEAYSPEIAEAQMKQILKGVLASKKRTSILVGDFNADPKTSGTDDRGATRAPNAYRSALDAGFFNPLPRRETCCFAEDLRLTNEKLDSWIDHVVTRPKLTRVSSGIVGNRTANRSGGLWPSDHAGIVATLRLK